MSVFIVPKNSGLSICKEIARNYRGEILEVRGEDVPLMVESLLKKNKKVMGITGEDLYEEFLLGKKDSSTKIVEKISWNDKNYIFGKPALCLLGPTGKKLMELKKKIKICINVKYKKLAGKYCRNSLKEYDIEKIYTSGATEEFFSKGVVDLVIDIVCSGKSAKEAGLEIYDKLFESNIVIIGDKNEI